MVFDRISDNPYRMEIKTVDVGGVANHVKYFPIEWINEEKQYKR